MKVLPTSICVHLLLLLIVEVVSSSKRPSQNVQAHLRYGHTKLQSSEGPRELNEGESGSNSSLKSGKGSRGKAKSAKGSSSKGKSSKGSSSGGKSGKGKGQNPVNNLELNEPEPEVLPPATDLSCEPQTFFRVNSGGNAFTALDGLTWESDAAYAIGGSTNEVANTTLIGKPMC